MTTDLGRASIEEQSALAARPFDVLGRTYEDVYGHSPAQLAAIDWLLARLPERAKVLDIGSGTGRPTAERLVAAGHRVTGCDVSRTMVGLARAQVPQAAFELDDVRTRPDAPGEWDAITAFFSLLQMPRPDIAATLRRIGGWLAPGGHFVYATVPFDQEWAEVVWLGQPVHVAGFPVEGHRRLLREAGLELVHEELGCYQPDFPGACREEHLFLHARKPGGPDRGRGHRESAEVSR